MSLKIYTSQYNYKGENRLDITVKSGEKTFAPTWDMVMAYKNKEINNLEYSALYGMLMDDSRAKFKRQWNELLSRDEVVLVCCCGQGDFCHRLLLANMLVNWFGCEYLGEI